MDVELVFHGDIGGHISVVIGQIQPITAAIAASVDIGQADMVAGIGSQSNIGIVIEIR